MKRSGVIYRYSKPARTARRKSKLSFAVGVGVLALSLGGIAGPLLAPARLETRQMTAQVQYAIAQWKEKPQPMPKSVPVIFNPLVTPDGSSIAPVNTEFSLIVPKVGIKKAPKLALF